MDTDRLKLFVKIVETGSVSAAARELHLSQPAASRNLQALEEEFGVELFDRKGRRLALLPAGRTLLPRARALLEQLASTARELEVTAQRGYHDVRIGTVDSIGTYIMPAVLPALRDAFENLGVKLVTSRTTDLLTRLDDDIDIAVIAWSGHPPVDGALRIASYELQYYGRRDRFPDLANVTDERELVDYPIAEIEAKYGQPSLIDPDAPSFAMTQSLASVKTLVLGGFGVGGMLDYMLDDSELEHLAKANIPHDPDCALWVVASRDWNGERPDAIREQIVQLVGKALRA